MFDSSAALSFAFGGGSVVYHDPVSMHASNPSGGFLCFFRNPLVQYPRPLGIFPYCMRRLNPPEYSMQSVEPDGGAQTNKPTNTGVLPFTLRTDLVPSWS